MAAIILRLSTAVESQGGSQGGKPSFVSNTQIYKEVCCVVR